MTDKGATAKYASDRLIAEISQHRPNPIQLFCCMHSMKNIEEYCCKELSEEAHVFLTSAARLIGSRWVSTKVDKKCRIMHIDNSLKF